MKRTYISLLIVCLLLNCFPILTNAANSSFPDVKGHWAEKAIMRWADAGVLVGANGKFRPNDTVTRAELATILNKMLKFPDASSNPFSDVKESDWYYQAAVNLRQQNMLHSPLKFFSGNQAIKRQEAVFMIAKAFGIKDSYPVAFNSFEDLELVEEWAKEYVKTMHYKGYINGKSGNLFNPADNITRAEVVSILNNMIDVHIDKPGIYDNLGGKKVLITSPDVTIQNSSPIHLFISPGVGSGKVYLDEKTVSSDPGNSYYYIVGLSADVLDVRGQTPEIYFTPLAAALGERDLRFEGGNGTKESPYQITNENQLLLLEGYSNNASHRSFHFIINNDITLQKPWVPIQFAGQLDGGGYTIKNMKINSDTPIKAAGLFYSIQSHGNVKNLTVQGDITVDGSYPNSNLGGIVGELSGTISDCRSDVNISVSNLSSNHIGGIAGIVQGKIENCTATGKITVKAGKITNSDLEIEPDNFLSRGTRISSFTGGIAGRTYKTATITGCQSSAVINVNIAEISGYSRGEINAGGVCGYQTGIVEKSSASKPGSVNMTISNTIVESKVCGHAGGVTGEMAFGAKTFDCASDIAVSVTGSDQSSAGGLIGCARSHLPDILKIARSYATGDVKASDAVWQNDVGGLIGHMEGGLVTECWSGGTVTASGDPVWINAAGGFVGASYESRETSGDNIIQNCYSIASVSVNGSSPVIGSFTGRTNGTFENCYGAGTINSSSVYGYDNNTFSGDTSGILQNCGDFANSSKGYPQFVTMNDDYPDMVKVTNGDLIKRDTYFSKKWDFNTIWTMPASGSYKLPALQNLDQSAQTKNLQPAHLK